MKVKETQMLEICIKDRNCSKHIGQATYIKGKRANMNITEDTRDCRYWSLEQKDRQVGMGMGRGIEGANNGELQLAQADSVQAFSKSCDQLELPVFRHFNSLSQTNPSVLSLHCQSKGYMQTSISPFSSFPHLLLLFYVTCSLRCLGDLGALLNTAEMLQASSTTLSVQDCSQPSG